MGDTEEQLWAPAAKDEGTGIYEEGLNCDFQYGVLGHPVALKMDNKGKITFGNTRASLTSVTGDPWLAYPCQHHD